MINAESNTSHTEKNNSQEIVNHAGVEASLGGDISGGWGDCGDGGAGYSQCHDFDKDSSYYVEEVFVLE